MVIDVTKKLCPRGYQLKLIDFQRIDNDPTVWVIMVIFVHQSNRYRYVRHQIHPMRHRPSIFKHTLKEYMIVYSNNYYWFDFTFARFEC